MPADGKATLLLKPGTVVQRYEYQSEIQLKFAAEFTVEKTAYLMEMARGILTYFPNDRNNAPTLDETMATLGAMVVKGLLALRSLGATSVHP